MSYFENVKNIQYEGPKSNNPLAFKFYNPEEKIGDKTMEEILRFSVAYWHTFTLKMVSDPFGTWNMQSDHGINLLAWTLRKHVWKQPLNFSKK